MQMVGRGLRVAEGKDYCVILDNVGLYKRFGLPSVDRDWQSMFEGRSSLEDILQEACLQVNSHNCGMDLMMDGDEEMMKIISHEHQQRMITDSYGYQIVEDEKGLKGIKDKDGKMILECQYKKIEVTNDGFAYCYIRKKIEKDGIWHVEDAQSDESFWVAPITHRKHYTRPVLFKRGYLNILREGDWCYVRNIPGLRDRPLRQWEIVADDNLCVIKNTYLIE